MSSTQGRIPKSVRRLVNRRFVNGLGCRRLPQPQPSTINANALANFTWSLMYCRCTIELSVVIFINKIGTRYSVYCSVFYLLMLFHSQILLSSDYWLFLRYRTYLRHTFIKIKCFSHIELVEYECKSFVYLGIFTKIYIEKVVTEKVEYQIFIKLPFWTLLNNIAILRPAKQKK